MIRVLHVLGGLNLGGAETMVMNLYRAIDRSQIQFDFIIHLQEHQAYEDEIREMGGRIYRFPKFSGKNIFEMRRIWKQFFLKHPEYKILHSHIRSYASVYIPIAKAAGLTTIVHSHSTSNGSGISAIVKDMLQLPIRHTADYLFACSDKAGKWLYGEKATKQPNYRMIPNGVDLKRFAFCEEKRQQMRQELGIAEDTFVLGHIGRITVPKNHQFLVELFAEYHKENPDSKLLLVGDGELFETVQQQCTQLGIQDAVIMAGSKTNTEDYYQAMDVFVFPSLWEGLGIVAIEAQANGLTCLVSENVPREAILMRNTKVLSLQAKGEWLDELKKVFVGDRMQTKNNSIQQYDICTIADWLQKFYLEQHEKVRR